MTSDSRVPGARRPVRPVTVADLRRQGNLRIRLRPPGDTGIPQTVGDTVVRVTLRSPAALLSGSAATAFLVLMVAVLQHAEPLFRIDAAISDAARQVALEYPAWR